MNKQHITKDVFLERLNEKYSEKITYVDTAFDYYDKNQRFNCKDHGNFTCRPCELVRNRRIGCLSCGREAATNSTRKTRKSSVGKMKKLRTSILGVGCRDILAYREGKPLRTAKMWYSLLARCYCEKTQQKNPTYIGCSMSEDWLTYSKFKADVEKMDGYDNEDWELDKDILIEDNKVYSLETCLFVPKEINSVFKKPSISKKGLPTGILPYTSKDGVRYMVYCSTGNKGVRLHIGTFKTLIDAENAYLKAKYEGIVRLCERYDTDLSLETKNAILKHAKRKTLDKVSASAL